MKKKNFEKNMNKKIEKKNWKKKLKKRWKKKKTGQGPIGPDLTPARGPNSFGPGAESPLINFESWKFVPTMETVANPIHIPDLVEY